MHIAILGRQPLIGMAELECLFTQSAVQRFSDTSALIDSEQKIDITQLGSSIKIGHVVADFKAISSWAILERHIIAHYIDKWRTSEHRITLGISVYDTNCTVRDIQKTALKIKSKLKKEHGVSVRIIPNSDPVLNSATSHHNKLGLSPTKVELIICKNRRGDVIVAESTGAQNITALARRDQGRPMRDAFVGMLPPKLALTMINLAHPKSGGTILDPFCGSGVVLQEASLLGYPSVGSDLSEKMIEYSQKNSDWLKKTHPITVSPHVFHGDAMDTTWLAPIDAVVTETYLGQPFSAFPAPHILEKVVKNCDHIISRFLQNLHGQITPETSLCIAVPAWRDNSGYYTHLPLTRRLATLGYERIQLTHATWRDLLYARDDQVVARELLILRKTI